MHRRQSHVLSVVFFFVVAAGCAGGAGDVDAGPVVDGCVGVLAIDDDGDALPARLIERFRVDFGGCSVGSNEVNCDASARDVDDCEADEGARARAIVADEGAAGVSAGCVMLCEIE